MGVWCQKWSIIGLFQGTKVGNGALKGRNRAMKGNIKNRALKAFFRGINVRNRLLNGMNRAMKGNIKNGAL